MWQKPDDGTFDNLQSRVVKYMQLQHVDDGVLAVMTEAYKNALKANNVVLSSPERDILFKKVTTQILNKLLSDGK